MAVKIFFCYAHEDEPLLNKLKSHLKPLQRQGLIDVWYDRDISAGTEWEREISEQLNSAQIILLLISPDFMDSDYCYGIEMQQALERDKRGEARVIPIILRPVYWQDVLGTLQALPTDAKPVMSSSWQYQDEAFFNATEGIRKVVMQLTSPPVFVSPAVPDERKQEMTTARVLTPAVQQGGNVSPFLSPLAVENLTLLRILTGHTALVYSVALSADGQTLVSGSADKTVKLWNPHTGELLRTLEGHTAVVYSVALSADGQTLVSGSADNTIKVWNLSRWKELRTLEGHIFSPFAYAHSVALSADGQTLVSGSMDKRIRVWNLPKGKELRTLKGHTAVINCVALSADGQTLASGSDDTTVKLWNPHTGELLRTLTGHTALVHSVALSADGQTLVSGSADKTVKLWNPHTGELLRTLEGHTAVVYSVALSADGQTLVSGSADKTVKLWYPHTGELLRTLTEHSRGVLSVAFSPNGQMLASGSDNTIKLWGKK